MSDSRLSVLLVQLPIPPPGLVPVRNNVPLAAGYLKLYADQHGLDEAFAIEIFPARLANAIGDQALVKAILDRRPWLVGFTCYVWNVERTLWIAKRLKEVRPDLLVVVGGPEITADNAWVLDHPSIDLAVIGEGEQTFAEMLAAFGAMSKRSARRTSKGGGIATRQTPRQAEATRQRRCDAEGSDVRLAIAEGIPGLWSRSMAALPRRRKPLAKLDVISSPYLAGILDPAEEQTLFLETVRGCVFRCKFCYYPKSFDTVRAVSYEKISANLRLAAERGVKEIVLLDPTLNQRPDFIEFLRLLAQHNTQRQWTCFGELRAEGIHAQTARLLREAGFTEIEVGIQSLDPAAQRLMGRTVNLKAFERGAKALLDEGITLRVDLILGLPGDTVDSVRRNIEYLHRSRLYTDVQVFNLSVLPGTAFRQQASQLGLEFQARPPYYALQTSTLNLEQLYELMEEAQEAFGLEFDPWPAPDLADGDSTANLTTRDDLNKTAAVVFSRGLRSRVTIDLDRQTTTLPPAAQRALALVLRLRSRDFQRRQHRAANLIRKTLCDNPHTSLDVWLEPIEGLGGLTKDVLSYLLSAAFQTTSYLDLYYSLHPNRLAGAKRLVVVIPDEYRAHLAASETSQISQSAAITWRSAIGRTFEAS